MLPISKYGLVLLLAVATTATSCKKDFLELNPPTSLTPAQALGTEADLQVALRGAYAGLRNVDLFGRTVPIIGDIMADNAYQHSVNTNRYTFFNNYTVTSGDANVLGLWSAAYTVILRANNIINSTLEPTPNIDQYKGEAFALRALAYFTLVRYFAKPFTDDPASLGVPIVLTYDADAKPGRNTVAEVYTQIVSDLTQGYTLMTKYTNSSQFSKYAAQSLLAKVYLSMGDYTNAKTAALNVINNSGLTTLTTANHAAYWANGAVRTDKLETLLEVSSDAVGNLAFDALSYLYSQNGNYGDLVVASDLYAKYSATGVRKGLYPVAQRPKATATGAGGPAVPTVDKYPVITGDYSDTKVLRISEMYLIAAEASLPANESDALSYVNFITTRRGADPIAATGAQLFEAIIEERRKELAFEGDRYMDLQRLKRDIVRSADYPAAVQIVPYSNFRRILPIPQQEVDANPALRNQQNTGY